MKFTIQQNVFSHYLGNAEKFLPKKETIPILSHIVLNASAAGLEIIAGNADTYIKSIIPSEDCNIEQSGSIAIPGKQLAEIVKKMSGEIKVSASHDEVSISAGKSEFDVSALDAEEYPSFPEVNGTSLVIKGSDFKDLVSATSYAVSDQENTPVLTGILFTQEGGGLKLTACDRHRLAKIEAENSGEDFLTIISGSTLVELCKIIKDDEMTLHFGQASMLAETEEFTFFSRILEGTYPQTDRLIPNSFSTEIEVSRYDLLSALERILIVAKESKTNTVKLTIDKNEIKIYSREQGKRARESIDVAAFSGEPLVISVNGKYMSEALKAITANEVTLSLNGKMNPIVVKGKDENSIHLLLPYRVAE